MKIKTITIDKATLLVVEFPKTHYFLHDNGWKLIGRLPDITESQSSKVVPTMPIQKGKTKRYITAKEAMHSLLQANEIYFENSIKHPRQMNMHPASVGWYNRQVQAYEEAQSKVWCKERTYLFIKVD